MMMMCLNEMKTAPEKNIFSFFLLKPLTILNHDDHDHYNYHERYIKAQ